MTLPVNARVGAAPNFIANLAAAHAFFALQDEQSAPSRLSKLKAELREMTSVLSWSPGSGRPARFLTGRSAQARLRTETVLRLAEQAGLPSLREYVVGQHVALIRRVASGTMADRQANIHGTRGAKHGIR